MRKPGLCIVLNILLSLFANICFAQVWEALNPPLNIFNGTIYTTTSDAAGNIYAGGTFKNNSNNNMVARWNGTSWSELGSGASALNANGNILTLAAYGQTIYAAGGFTNKNFKTYVAKWNGASWSELDNGNSLHANDLIYSIAVDKSGNVYAAGRFTNASDKYYVAKWNGSTWSELGTAATALNANNAIFAVAVDTLGNVYAGGYFTNALGKGYVAKWDGNSWTELGSGSNALNANDYITCLATDNKGNVYAAGRFRNSNNENYLAKWDGTAWSEVKSSVNALHANDAINTIAVKNSNEIYIAGIFTKGFLNYYIAKWDGITWSEVNNPQSPLLPNDPVQTLAIDAKNNVYAAGKFLNKSGHSFVAKWDGRGWNEMGSKGDPFYTPQPIYQIVGDAIGNVYVSGYFQDLGGRYYLQHWNGSGWRQLQPPDTSNLFLHLDNVAISAGSHQMAVDKKGNLYVTGRKVVNVDNFYDCVLKWDGAQWSILEDFPNSLGSINNVSSIGLTEIEIDSQDNIYVAGNLNDSTYGVSSLAKWNGTTWSRLPGSYSGYIQNFCVAADGNIYAYGNFSSDGKVIIANYNSAKHYNWVEVRGTNSRMGVPGFNVFMALETDSKNNLYVNGNFTNAAGNRYIAKWDGASWSELGVTDNLGWGLVVDNKDNVYSDWDRNLTTGDPIKRWNGTSWVGVGIPIGANGVYPWGGILATGPSGDVYTQAPSFEPGVGAYIVKYGAAVLPPPKLSSFTPAKGSLGTAVTIKGKNLTGTGTVRFGGTKAASLKVLNDSTLTAIVAEGSTGSVLVETLSGSDSLQTFTYTCDSVKRPVPYIMSSGDTLLSSSYAEYYQWYYNNRKLENETAKLLHVDKAGLYHVEISTTKLCWISSLDYPILISRNPQSDSLKMNVYPNPSSGSFTVYVKLPQTSTVKTYVQVFDANGLQILQTTRLVFYGNEIKIPLTINSKGTFFVKVFVNNDVVQQSIIIM